MSRIRATLLSLVPAWLHRRARRWPIPSPSRAVARLRVTNTPSVRWLVVASWLLTTPMSVFAQDHSTAAPQRKGFVFGAAIGVGVIKLTGPGVDGKQHWAPSFPDLQFGHMLSDRLALLVLLPGSTYRYDNVDAGDRPRTRGFEGIVPSVQYWVADRWWVKGGAGLTFDAPAFYDIENSSERTFHFGPAFSVSTGFEAWRRTRYSLDVRAQFHAGRASVPGTAHRKGSALNILVGFTRY